MKRYLVTWETDIEADDPEDAAKEALLIQRDPLAWATVFDVMDVETGDSVTVDLGEGEVDYDKGGNY